MKVIICSEPKAGTYLCSAILKNLGLHQTYIHANGSLTNYKQYDKNKLNECRKYNSKFTKTGLNLKNIKDNSFLVGHIMPTSKNIEKLKEFKKIILTRDLAERKESIERFKLESGRARASIGSPQGMKDWCLQEDTFDLSFNDMININIQKINELQIFLFNNIIKDSQQIMERSLAEKTLTKSSLREGDNW